MAKISHTKIKQPSFGEKRPKLTYTKISRFTVYEWAMATNNRTIYLVPQVGRVFMLKEYAPLCQILHVVTP
jgi:hypothetical protein